MWGDELSLVVSTLVLTMAYRTVTLFPCLVTILWRLSVVLVLKFTPTALVPRVDVGG